MNTKTYTLFDPGFTVGSGQTTDLISKLIQSKATGNNDGADEILSVISLLSKRDILPFIAYCQTPDGPHSELSSLFIDYISEGRANLPKYALRYRTSENAQDFQVYVAGVASATAAIYLALKNVNVSGGEVITTSLNYVGVVNAIVMSGAKPRFVDICKDNWCMDPKQLPKSISKKTKAIVLTHLNNYADLQPFHDILKDRGDIPLIQDASLAIGSKCNGLKPGLLNLGDHGATIFSLATSKIISGLGGALITTNDHRQIRKIIRDAYQGLSLTDMGVIESFGANFKMNDINATIAIEQLKVVAKLLEKRRLLKEIYDSELKDILRAGRIEMQLINDESVITHYGVLIPDRKRVATNLYNKHSIHIGLWHTFHNQDVYKRKYGSEKVKLPVTDEMSDNISFLPFHTSLSNDDVKYICDALKEEL